MKNKINYFVLLICAITSGLNTYAQGETCATATPASLGINTADGPSTGGEASNICSFPNGPATNSDWYTYTASGDASVTIASCLGGVDTRVSVYDGTCDALYCIASNDDFCEISPGGDIFASQTTFTAIAGTTYYIQWDDRWSPSGFEWMLSGDPSQCPGLLLNMGDACNLVGDGDGIVDETCTCVALSAPECATLLTPANGASSVPIDVNNDDAVTLTWALNGFFPADGINIYWGFAPDNLDLLGAVASNITSVNITELSIGTYFWSAVPFNSVGEAVGCDVFWFEAGEWGLPVPNCPSLFTPNEGAIDVPLTGVDFDTVTLTWFNSEVPHPEPPDANRIYWGLNPTALPLFGEIDANSETVEITGLEGGLTYYWSVIPYNFIGEAEFCSVFSFTTEVYVECPTDFNIDGKTDGDDFSIFLGNFGIPCDCPTDLNGDLITDGADFAIFLGNFGLDCPLPNK